MSASDQSPGQGDRQIDPQENIPTFRTPVNPFYQGPQDPQEQIPTFRSTPPAGSQDPEEAIPTFLSTPGAQEKLTPFNSSPSLTPPPPAPDAYSMYPHQEPIANPYEENPYQNAPGLDYAADPKTMGPYGPKGAQSEVASFYYAEQPPASAAASYPYSQYQAGSQPFSATPPPPSSREESDSEEEAQPEEMSGIPQVHRKIVPTLPARGSGFINLLMAFAFVLIPIFLVIYGTTNISQLITGKSNPVSGGVGLGTTGTGAGSGQEFSWTLSGANPIINLYNHSGDDKRDTAPIVVQQGASGVVKLIGTPGSGSKGSVVEYKANVIGDSSLRVEISNTFKGQIRLEVPENAILNISNYYSSTTLKNLRNTVNIENYQNKVVVEQCTIAQGSFLLSYSGDISVTRSTLQGPMTLSSYSGKISIDAESKREGTITTKTRS